MTSFTLSPEIDPEWTEGYDADIPRVDLVGKAANGSAGFLVMKAPHGGLIDPDTVRDLIAKATPDPAPETVTVTGTPSALAAMIQSPSARKEPTVRNAPIAKAKSSKASLVAIYDENGNLVGLVDQADIQEVGSPSGGQKEATAPTQDPNAAAAAQPGPPMPVTKAQARLTKALAPMPAATSQRWQEAVGLAAFRVHGLLGCGGARAAEIARTLGAEVLEKSRGRATPEDLNAALDVVFKAVGN